MLSPKWLRWKSIGCDGCRLQSPRKFKVVNVSGPLSGQLLFSGNPDAFLGTWCFPCWPALAVQEGLAEWCSFLPLAFQSRFLHWGLEAELDLQWHFLWPALFKHFFVFFCHQFLQIGRFHLKLQTLSLLKSRNQGILPEWQQSAWALYGLGSFLPICHSSCQSIVSPMARPSICSFLGMSCWFLTHRCHL